MSALIRIGLSIAFAVGMATSQVATQPGASSPLPNDDDKLVIPVGVVSLINDIDVPAKVEGIIEMKSCQEGARIEHKSKIAVVDDQLSKLQLAAAKVRFENAQQRAADDISVRYAKATLALARREYQTKLGLAKSNAVTSQEVERFELAVKQAELQVEKSQKEFELVQGDVVLEDQNIKAAQSQLERHLINAPFSGNIVEIYRQSGEWVREGEKVVRLADYENLRVEGHFDSREFNPHQLIGRSVEVVATMARDQKEVFVGNVVYVSMEQKSSELYVVKAEVKNRQVDGHWLLMPGNVVEVRISLPN